MILKYEDIQKKYKEDSFEGNPFCVPKPEKVVINIGLSEARLDRGKVTKIADNLAKISGQRPVKTEARKAISAFKIKEGQVVGLKVTLRGKRMYQFLYKLINLNLPRIRDFIGINPKSIDRSGNLTIGLKDSNSFFELTHDDQNIASGMEITIATTAKTRDEASGLFESMGMIFSKGK